MEHSKSGKITRKSQKIANLEFENHKNLNFSIFRRVVGAWGKKYLYKYYLAFFKISPSFNNPAEIVLNKVHIVLDAILLNILVVRIMISRTFQ